MPDENQNPVTPPSSSQPKSTPSEESSLKVAPPDSLIQTPSSEISSQATPETSIPPSVPPYKQPEEEVLPEPSPENPPLPENLSTEEQPLSASQESLDYTQPQEFQDTQFTQPEAPPISPSSDQTPPPTVQDILSESKPSFFKKFLSILLVLAIFLGLGFAFYKYGLPRIKREKGITLNYWGLWEPEEVINSVLADWEKTHPNIKINYSRQSPKEYRERLQSSLARNEGPDIFRFHITWVPMLKNELDPIPQAVMSISQFESSFYKVASTNLSQAGNYLGIPLMIDTLALYYNEDIFQAAGKTPPTSWEELRKTAYELTVLDEEGRIQTAGVALGTTRNVDHWSDILGLMMLQNGADLSRPGDCSKRAEEEICLGPDALTFYTLFSGVDHVWDDTLPVSTNAFATGKVAMYLGPSWRVFDIKYINPRLNFKIVPVPQLPQTNANWATFWVEGVSQKSQHKTEAWEFLKFLSSPQTMEKLYQVESNLRLFGEPYSRTDMANKLNSNPLVAPFINQAVDAQTWYLCSSTFDNGINDRMIKYFEDAVNAVNSGKSSKEALQTTSQGISQLLSQYGLGGYVAK